MKPKAYSYIRFSTPEQKKGDSLKRQLDASKKYCDENGLTLDESLNLRDLGLSAYHGTHRTKGALGVFLDLVQDGKIERGSVLIVENLDRLSRQKPLTAFHQFSAIVEAGIELVTLTDMQKYTEKSINENAGAQLWMSLGNMIRAYQESERKSGFLKSAWDAKRKAGKILTGKCPAWLVLSDDKTKFIQRKEVVRAIKRIFKLKLQGIGEERIANELNELHNTQGLWSPQKNKRNRKDGGGWRKSYVAKILRNRAVIGEFMPHRLKYIEAGKEDRRVKTKEGKEKQAQKKVVNGYITRVTALDEPIANYYPVIIDEQTFNRVQGLIQEKIKANGYLGGQTGKAKNLFVHIVQCRLCKGPMHFIDKGKPPKGGQYLHCDRSRRNLGCKAKPIRYDEFYDIIFKFLNEFDASQFDENSEGVQTELDDILASLEDYNQRKKDVLQKINNLVGLAEDSGDKDLVGRLRERRTELLQIERQIGLLEIRRDSLLASSQNQGETLDTVKKLKALLDRAKADEEINLRLRMQAELRRLLEHIRVCPLNSGESPLTLDAYPFDSKYISHMSIRFKDRKLTRMLKNKLQLN